MRGSIIFASMYIGGGLAMRIVGLSVGSVAVSSSSALNELCSLISCSHCLFSSVSVFFPLANGITLRFCWELPPSSFLRGVLVRCSRHWLVIFPCCRLFFCICRVCSYIYKVCFSFVSYFYWWNLHDSTFCRWAFTLPLSLPSCRTFTGALFRTSV